MFYGQYIGVWIYIILESEKIFVLHHMYGSGKIFFFDFEIVWTPHKLLKSDLYEMA